jgi:hypothetical protein
MKLQELFLKLRKSEAWKQQSKENNGIFFCAAFTILNFKQKTFEYSLDFRDDKNLFAFKIPEDKKSEVAFTKDALLENPKPLERIEEKEIENIKIDIDSIEKIAGKAILDNKVMSALDEAIAVLQNLDGKVIWNLTCICSGFTIINLHIDPFSGKILKFEKKNLMDFASIRKPEKR